MARDVLKDNSHSRASGAADARLDLLSGGELPPVADHNQIALFESAEHLVAGRRLKPQLNGALFDLAGGVDQEHALASGRQRLDRDGQRLRVLIRP